MIDTLFRKIKEKWQTVATLVFMVVAIVFSVSIFIPAKYSSDIKMIIIQNHQSEEVDAFSAAKSAEYLSDIISNVIFTESFIQDMLDAPFEVKKDFSHSSEERMKIWEKTVDVDKENNTGILNIRSLDKSRNEAEQIAESIAWALNVKGSKYHGGGESIEIKIIDGPITSERPAVPNVLLNTLLAFVIGLIGSLSVLHFFEDFELILFRRKDLEEREMEIEKREMNRQKIADSLEKIRENLKNQMKMESYSMEDLEARMSEADNIEIPKKEENFIEELPKEEKPVDFATEEIEEFVSPEISKDKPASAPAPAKVKAPTAKKENYSKKGTAPQNLPVFENGDEENALEKNLNDNGNGNENSEKGFISMEELNREAEKMGLAEEEKQENGSKYEASGDEVKERLNKLLRGEL